MELIEHTPSFIRRKQAKLDYRKFGNSYGIDQLLILDVENYIELDGVNKNIIFKISPLVIDMEDNSFVYVSSFKHKFSIMRRWREPPNYPLLMKAITKNIAAVFEIGRAHV